VSCPALLAISVIQLKYRFNANAGVTSVLAVISTNATIIAIILRDVWVDFMVIDKYVKIFIGNMNRITIR
jgi:hypothetical protein